MVKAQLQSLELADAYKKRFMPQNGQVAVLKCSPTWKKMRKSFKTLSELKLELIPKACKREAMAHIIRPPPPPLSLKVVHLKWDSISTFILFHLNLKNFV